MKNRFTFLAGLLLILIVQPGIAKESPALKQLITESRARADIVETTQKAVVHIQVEKIYRTGSSGTPYNDPYDLFNDEFFDQFFPGWRHNRSQPGQPREFKQQGAGSGAIVDKEGHILTNNHVVGEADKIKVRLFDGREFDAKIVGTDPLTDIAVIKITAENLDVIPMGDSDDIRIGETVIAIGNPFGLSHTVTMGIVSAKGRSNVDIADYEDFIQTDAAINPGNSGGPLINLNGEVIGVNTAIFTRSGGYQGIGFSVPINMAKNVMNQLVKNGKVSRGWLGILLQDISHDLRQALDLKNSKGALVAEVTEDSPAEKAGLKRGDVIIKYNGKMINNAGHLKNKVGLTFPNTEVKLDVIRKGKIKSLTVKLGTRPSQAYASSGFTDTGNSLGMKVQNLTPDLAERFGYQRYKGGVVITNITPNSPAANAGLQVGYLVLEVNRAPIDNIKAFQKAIKSTSLEKGILLLIGTQNGAQYVIVKK